MRQVRLMKPRKAPVWVERDPLPGGVRLVDWGRANPGQRRRPYRLARYDSRLALYDSYIGGLKRGWYYSPVLPSYVLIQGWRDRRAELQRELESKP